LYAVDQLPQSDADDRKEKNSDQRQDPAQPAAVAIERQSEQKHLIGVGVGRRGRGGLGAACFAEGDGFPPRTKAYIRSLALGGTTAGSPRTSVRI